MAASVYNAVSLPCTDDAVSKAVGGFKFFREGMVLLYLIFLLLL